MTYPLITIGVTAYNAEKTIGFALQSAAEQEWDNIEIIVVDDCSRDGTVKQIRNIAKDLKLTLIEHTTNQGVAAARNTILKHAAGQYIAFFDDDDQSSSDRLQKQYQRLQEGDPLKRLCFSARLQHYPDGVKHYAAAPASSSIKGLCGVEMAKRILWGKPLQDGFGSMPTCSMMAHRDVFQTLKGFDPSFRRCEDTDLVLRHVLNGGCIIGCGEPLVQQSMTYGNDKTLDQELTYNLKLIEKYKGFIEEHYSYAVCQTWLNARYAYLKKNHVRFISLLLQLWLSNPLKLISRLYWAWPNARFNKKQKRFHNV